MSAIKLGHINYLNCLPLTYSLAHQHLDNTSVIQDVPAVLNQQIITGKLDISPVSSIIYARNYQHLQILPQLSIMADGDVQSIYLVSKKPIEAISSDKILLTSQSATSHCLLKIILQKSYQATPKYEICNLRTDNIFPDPEATASLFIGDNALFINYHRQPGLYYYDIGKEWKRLTGLCMVYALWVVRENFALAHPQDTADVSKFICSGFRQGFKQLDTAITELAGTKPFTHEQLVEYLHVIRWELSEEQLTALNLFYRYAYELKLIPAIPNLKIFKQ